jgi:Amt family ammonium transporter
VNVANSNLGVAREKDYYHGLLANGTAAKAKQSADDAKTDVQRVSDFLDRFRVLLAAVLFMQAGFKCLEVGMARPQHGAGTGVMNLMNWLILCLVFYLLGFGLMFGHSPVGWFGTDLFLPTSDPVLKAYKPLGLEFFLFQLAFAATTATIIDGAMAERTALGPYSVATVIVGVFIYPMFGHWAWNPWGWLKWIGPVYHDILGDESTRHQGFHDFAGSTVVHSVGAWIAVAGVYAVGNRRFRFPRKQGLNVQFEPFNIGYAVLGVIMLWFGWWGFNGGSQLKYDKSIAMIILNTNLAGAGAGLASYLQAIWSGATNRYEKIIGGVLGGLVAITAGCDVASPVGAMAIGATAGLVHNWAFDFLNKEKFDDVAGAIPVHGACGIWGTLCAGLAIWWGKPDGSHAQMLVQLAGIGMAILWAGGLSFGLFALIERWLGLRMSIAEEGLQAGEEEDQPNYTGGIRVSVRRPGGLWSRFIDFKPYLRAVAKKEIHEFPTRNSIEKAFKQNLAQFIRDDDTKAAIADVYRALDDQFVGTQGDANLPRRSIGGTV